MVVLKLHQMLKHQTNPGEDVFDIRTRHSDALRMAKVFLQSTVSLKMPCKDETHSAGGGKCRLQEHTLYGKVRYCCSFRSAYKFLHVTLFHTHLDFAEYPQLQEVDTSSGKHAVIFERNQGAHTFGKTQEGTIESNSARAARDRDRGIEVYRDIGRERKRMRENERGTGPIGAACSDLLVGCGNLLVWGRFHIRDVWDC